MGQGERVQVEDGFHEVHTVQKSTFPGKKYCLLLNIEEKKGLTPFLTDKDITPDCQEVRIAEMEIKEIFYDE